jgi:hypothetical protein
MGHILKVYRRSDRVFTDAVRMPMRLFIGHLGAPSNDVFSLQKDPVSILVMTTSCIRSVT